MFEQLYNQYEDEFDATAALGHAIEDENARAHEARNFEDADLRELLVEAISDEQKGTLLEIKAAVELLPYSRLGAASLELYRRSSAEQQQLAERAQQSRAEISRIEQLFDAAVRLAPRKLAELEALKASRIDTVQAMHAANQPAVIDMAAHETIFSRLGAAWPVPKAIILPPQPKAAEPQPELIPTPVAVNEEFNMSRAQNAIVQQALERIPNGDMAQYMEFYFKENFNATIDVEELATFLSNVLPGEGIDRLAYYQKRVVTFLGPKGRGGPLRERLLEEYGLRLQDGWSTVKQFVADGHYKQVSRKRIYRAIDNRFDVSKDVEFHDIRNLRTYTKWINPAESEHEATQASTEASIEQPTLEYGPHRPTWQDELRIRTDEAIKRLIEDDLLSRETISSRVISQKSSSNAHGTEENQRRLVAARLMTPAEFATAEMTPLQNVLGLMLNSNRQYLGKGKRQPEAIAIVSEVLEARLSEREAARAAEA